MYQLKTLSNKELIQHHNLVKYTTSLSISDILDDPLFIVEDDNDEGILKIIPLFNCDDIVSTNEMDKSFGGDCVIAINDENTILSFTSNVVISDFEIYYDIMSKYGDKLLVGIIMDSVNKIGLSNISLLVEMFNSNLELKKKYKLSTDVFGGYVLKLDGYSNRDILKITAEYGDIKKEIEV